MKRNLLSLLIVMITVQPVLFGQSGMRQAGFRMGYTGGIFYQLSNEAGNAEIAYNAMLGFRNNRLQLTGLRIVYGTAINSISHDLYFAWGYGGHAGFMNIDRHDYYHDSYGFQRRQFCPVIGIDGWLAAEYRIREIPLNISLNIKPYLELTIPQYVRVMPFDLALSVSYIF